MRILHVPLPVMGFVISTRAALGLGIGLLVAGKLSAERRRKVGLALVGIGVATTVPALALMLRPARRTAGISTDRRLIGATRYPRRGDEIQA